MGVEVFLILLLLSIVACGIIMASTFPLNTWWRKLSLMLIYCAAGAQIGSVVIYLTELAKNYF